jgi:hypothetical protein
MIGFRHPKTHQLYASLDEDDRLPNGFGSCNCGWCDGQPYWDAVNLSAAGPFLVHYPRQEMLDSDFVTTRLSLEHRQKVASLLDQRRSSHLGEGI